MEEETEGLLGWGEGKTEAYHGIDLLVFFSPAESRRLVALRCADPPALRLTLWADSPRWMDSSFSSTASIFPLDPERTVNASWGLSAELSLNKLYSS